MSTDSGLITLTASAFVAPPPASGKYRSDLTQPYLFQAVSGEIIPARLPGSVDFQRDIYGPTWRYVDAQVEWPWKNSGGDYLDKNLVAQGTTPWATVLTNAVAVGANVHTYSMNLTELAQHVQTTGKWMAFKLDCPTSQRLVSMPFGTSPPNITYVYTDGESETLPAWCCGKADASTSVPQSTTPVLALPVFLEFRRPDRAITSCTLSFTVTYHYSGTGQCRVFLLDPPMNADAVRLGTADASIKDADLAAHPSTIGYHSYADGTAYADYCYTGGAPIANFDSQNAYDPALYNLGPQNLQRLPHEGLGKWIGAPANSPTGWQVVPSTYTGNGFEPLAPGIGALRSWMKKDNDIYGDPIVDGSAVGSGGTLASSSKIFLPPEDFGLLKRIFIRFYVRIGTPSGGPYTADIADRLNVFKGSGAAVPYGSPVWIERGGKWGITPDHKTTLGGNSASSGGPYGWQMRYGWTELDEPLGTSDVGGWVSKMHLFDFGFNATPGWKYGSDAPQNQAWAQRGGMGGMLYAHRWYCVEMDFNLNSTDTLGVLANGTNWVVNGVPQYFTPDGHIRLYVDGRLCYERMNMVFRSAPTYNQIEAGAAFNPSTSLLACRELGIRSLWNNWFHGGVTRSNNERVHFITGLCWGREYIGPMRLS